MPVEGSRNTARVLRLPRRALGSPTYDQPHRKRLRNGPAQDGAHERLLVADNRQNDGVQVGDCRIKNLATVERNKSVAEDHRRCQIHRRHRGHPSAGKPRRLIASSPNIPHSSSAVSEHLSELIGYPISRSLTTYCVRLELRSLPSTGITRLPRYNEPLRHPRAPGLSLTSVRLVIPDHALGLPVLRTLSLCTCCRHYPGTATGGTASLISPQSCQPSPIWQSGRPVHCPFRGLLGVHSRYGLHTRAVTVYRDTLTRGFSHFVTSIAAPVASGWSGCRVGLAPTGKRRLCTAHAKGGHYPTKS